MLKDKIELLNKYGYYLLDEDNYMSPWIHETFQTDEGEKFAISSYDAEIMPLFILKKYIIDQKQRYYSSKRRKSNAK